MIQTNSRNNSAFFQVSPARESGESSLDRENIKVKHKGYHFKLSNPNSTLICLPSNFRLT